MLTAEDLEQLGGFARYKDVDGDGVGYRTLPGTNHPAAPTSRAAAATTRRRSTPSAKTITSTTWTGWRTSSKPCASTFRRRWSTTTTKPRSASSRSGTSHYAVEESRDQLQTEYGIETSYLRLRAYPFNEELLDFIRRHERVYVVDQNRDAQLLALMRLEFDAGRDRQAAQHALLRRPAARRAHRHRRNRSARRADEHHVYHRRPRKSTASAWRS